MNKKLLLNRRNPVWMLFSFAIVFALATPSAAQEEDALAKALLRKLLTFATGREMGFSDRPEINRLVAQSAQRGHGIRNLFHLAISSEIFRHK